MSREIKFRVWDILGDRMLQWGDIFDLPAWEIFPGTPEQRAFNVMQYTGLKDKNGKEIYEGDIIDFHWTEDKDRGVAEFVDGCFKITKMKRHTPIPLFLRYPTHEVIGNIYENPELIHGT
ncbi:YopX family protein [Paenibacillus sp. FSL L8-0499]|uniref:YopX family protein n=1 Tax=Paenibacillus sp. FSL L8-0499 TaxID=2975334 RepID=UPI0030F55B3C